MDASADVASGLAYPALLPEEAAALAANLNAGFAEALLSAAGQTAPKLQGLRAQVISSILRYAELQSYCRQTLSGQQWPCCTFEFTCKTCRFVMLDMYYVRCMCLKCKMVRGVCVGAFCGSATPAGRKGWCAAGGCAADRCHMHPGRGVACSGNPAL